MRFPVFLQLDFLGKIFSTNITLEWLHVSVRVKVRFPITSVFNVHFFATNTTQKCYSTKRIIPVGNEDVDITVFVITRSGNLQE